MDTLLKLQPTVFISSIISEFKDLRGALRYYFISNGFRVLNSESPDFNADCGLDSLDNCKRQIDNSDYYFLIIGDEPGSTFTLPNNEITSVTKEEFRHFLQRRKEGQVINPIFIMREETWNNYRESNSKIDPFQIEFIKEIIESEIHGKIMLGNWRYTFNDYSDIISILETKANGLHVDLNRKRTIYREYIKREIFGILKTFLSRETKASLKSIVELLKLPDVKFDSITDEKFSKEEATRIQVFLIMLKEQDILGKIERVFNYIAIGEFSYFNPQLEKYCLPEYIKLIIQCLEMLDSVLRSARETKTFDEIINRNIRDFHLKEFEFLFISKESEKLGFVIKRLSKLILLFENNWDDFEREDDMCYEYRGTYHDLITDLDIVAYARSIFPEVTKND